MLDQGEDQIEAPKLQADEKLLSSIKEQNHVRSVNS